MQYSILLGKPLQDVLRADTTIGAFSRSNGGLSNLKVIVDDSVDASGSFNRDGGGNACIAFTYPDGTGNAATLRLSMMRFENVRFEGKSGTAANKTIGVYTQGGGNNSQFVNCIFYRVWFGWWGHYPTANLTSCELAFDHCDWQDCYFNGCVKAGRWVNINSCTFTNHVCHAGASASGFEWMGVVSVTRSSCDIISVSNVMIESCASDPLKFTRCNRYRFEDVYIAGAHSNITLDCDYSTFSDLWLSNGVATAPQIVLTGDYNYFDRVALASPGGTNYSFDIVDDQGMGNRVNSVSYYSGAGARNRALASVTRDPRIRHVRDSASLLLGYTDPPFVSGNDLLVPPDAITPTAATEGTDYTRIQDTTADLGRALHLLGAGGFFTDTNYLNGEHGNVIGEFIPKARVRFYFKEKAATGGTQAWSVRYGAAATVAGSKTVTLTSSYQVFSFDCDFSGAAAGDKIQIQANNIGGGGAAPTDLAWVMFRVYDADVLASGDIQTYGKLGVGGLSGAALVPTISSGAGSPQSVVTAPVGSVYLCNNGGAATSFYVKESGTGNTGWVAK